MITLQTDPSATEGWYQIEAYGEHTKTLEDGTEIIEVIDEQTAQSVCGQTMPPAGILIDRDHLSRDDEAKLGKKANKKGIIDANNHP